MKLKELEEWLKDICNLIVDLNISINNAKFLIKEQGTETEQRIKEIDFFKHHIYQLKFIIIIQLCKIFDNRESQKRNLNKLFNKLKHEGYDSHLNDVLRKNFENNMGFKNKQDVKNCINLLENEMLNKKDTLKKVLTLRDQVYAHYDPNNDSENISWQELESLILFVNHCYNKIDGELNNCETKFEKTLIWDVKNVISNFAQFQDFHNTKAKIKLKTSSKSIKEVLKFSYFFFTKTILGFGAGCMPFPK